MHSFLSLLLALSFLQAAPAADSMRLRWIPNPRTTRGDWVADPAHHLAPATVSAIDSVISALERERSVEIAVVVADSLDGLEPADAALALHRRWGVGKRQRDNGLVFLWSPALHKVQVSVGYGLEGVLPDARVGRIEADSVVPHFRRGEFDAGMLAGVEALASASREEAAWRPEGIAPGRPTSPDESRRDRIPLPLFAGLGLGVLALAGVGGATAWRYRPRRCPNGHGFMRRLSEAEDDAQLSQVEGLEERLGSVDYDVWVCGSCDARIVEGHRKLFSKYAPCPKCSRRTLETNTVTLVAATTRSTGRQRVIRNCRNCGFHDQREVVTPMISTDSGSSGSSFGGGGGGGGGGGSSSFGGGSAGGGGAGRSY